MCSTSNAIVRTDETIQLNVNTLVENVFGFIGSFLLESKSHFKSKVVPQLSGNTPDIDAIRRWFKFHPGSTFSE